MGVRHPLWERRLIPNYFASHRVLAFWGLRSPAARRVSGS